MDLMTLAAKITLDDSGFNKGVNQAEKTGKSLAGKMSAMTVAVGNIAADMIKKGAAAVKNIVDGAVDGFADYQQLVGGVETLFKTSASKVVGYAEQSYKTTGLSMNQYMETVTSFSASLLQGLGNDTAKAADIANMAITDMADNANKMGTDISSIQNAYQGFAKQNYTMLDNLKLGYGGTREEMVRLINDSGVLGKEIKKLDGVTFDQILEAIHKIQTEMGITGTTAKEASDTISGSKASLKAAFEDLMSVIGGAGDKSRMDQAMENFKTSFSTYMENYIPTLVHTIAGSGSLVTAVAESIADLPTTLLSEIGKAGLKSGTEMVGGISKITSWLISSITEMFKSASANEEEIANFGKAIGDFLGTAISDIVVNAPDILNGIIDVGVKLAGGLVEGLFKGLFGEDAEVDKITDQLGDSIYDAEMKATKGGALIAYLQSLQEMYGDAAKETEEWKQAIDELKGVMPESEDVFTKFAGDINGALSALQAMNDELRKTAINSALMKALQDEYTLLTQQTLEYNKQKAIYDRNKFIQDSLRGDTIRTIQENAQAQLTAMGDSKDWSNAQKSRANKLQNLINGYDVTGVTKLENYDVNALAGVLATTLDVFKVLQSNGEEIDVDAINDTYIQAGENMRQAQDAMKEQAKEIEATKQGIEDTKSAVLEASQQLNESFGTTASGIDSNGALVSAALASVAAQIASVHFGGGSGGESGGGLFGRAIDFINNALGTMFTGHATGMDYVPYNGYRAELHRGEAVLTKSQADNYRSSRGSVDINQAVGNAVESAMSKVFVMLNGDKVGDLTTKRIKKNINASTYNRLRSMGG